MTRSSAACFIALACFACADDSTTKPAPGTMLDAGTAGAVDAGSSEAQARADAAIDAGADASTSWTVCLMDPDDPIAVNSIQGARPRDPDITGMEPDCEAAFRRALGCYLARPGCTKGDVSNLDPDVAEWSQAYCGNYTKQEGGLAAFARGMNAKTACDAHLSRQLCMLFDSTRAGRDRCYE